VKRKILRAASIAAITGAGLFAFSAPAAAHPHFGGSGQYSAYNAGFFSGNQFSSVVQAPISVCGNAVAIGGFASASCRGGSYAWNR
jgi:hypothetical protein